MNQSCFAFLFSFFAKLDKPAKINIKIKHIQDGSRE